MSKTKSFEELLEEYMDDHQLEDVEDVLGSEFLESLPEKYPIKVQHVTGMEFQLDTMVLYYSKKLKKYIVLDTEPKFGLCDDLEELMDQMSSYEEEAAEIESELK